MASSNPALAQEKKSELSVYFKNLEWFEISQKVIGKTDVLSVEDLKNVIAYMESLEEFNRQDQDNYDPEEDPDYNQDQEETIWTKDYNQDCYNPKKEI